MSRGFFRSQAQAKKALLVRERPIPVAEFNMLVVLPLYVWVVRYRNGGVVIGFLGTFSGLVGIFMDFP